MVLWYEYNAYGILELIKWKIIEINKGIDLWDRNLETGTTSKAE